MWVWLIATLVRNVCVHVELKKLYAATTAKQYLRTLAAPMVFNTIPETQVEEISGSSQQSKRSGIENPLGGTSRVMFVFHVVN